METCDFLVIGAGVIGLSISRELRRRWPSASILLIDKESSPDQHASGRNSGVLHAGFYYAADSLKAQLTRTGNLAWTDYCRTLGLPLRSCGKLVVASCEEELPVLDELFRRGQVNGVPLEMVTAGEASKIEPRARTVERALYSPSTSVVDPIACMTSLAKEALLQGIRLRFNCAYQSHRGNHVITESEEIDAGFIINAAGLYADRIARDFGFSQDYQVLPFKGLYLYSEEPPNAFRTHIYPVPDIRNPFLGVHVTVTVDGRAKLGPTAIPALWRENYGGLAGFSIADLSEIVSRQARLFLSAGFDFRRLAWEEIQKNSKKVMVSLASRIAKGVSQSHYKRWGKPGIRAQLMNTKSNTLIMDFLIENDRKSLHVLNAVSPGFTCAFPFANYIVTRIEKSV